MQFMDGTGVGEGEGEKNISDEIEYEEQLLGQKGGDQEEGQGEHKQDKGKKEEDFQMENDFQGDNQSLHSQDK